MEIERKFLIKGIEDIPFDLEKYEHKEYVQGYLNTEPVVRVRNEGGEYVLTYKSAGLMVREEYNLPLNKEAFEHLIKKADGRIIEKTRYFIPLSEESLMIELDIFHGQLSPLILAEVEFESEESANAFEPPKWFGEDVTNDGRYHNSNLSKI